MLYGEEDEYETHQSQRNLALSTIDDLTEVKLELLDSGKEIPRFINNAISYLNKKYLTQEETISEMLMKR